MVFRIYVANATPLQVAEIAQSLGLSGTVTSSLGFGEWGIEETAVIEIGGIEVEGVRTFTDAIFLAFPNEDAVYVTTATATAGEVWWRDGRVT